MKLKYVFWKRTLELTKITTNNKQPGLQIVTMESQNQTVQLKPIISKTKSKKNQSVQWQETLCHHTTIFVLNKLTLSAFAFLPRSRPPLMILINLLGLDMLLICEAAGEGIELVIGATLSKLSRDCFDVFIFFTLCCPYKPSKQDSWFRQTDKI